VIHHIDVHRGDPVERRYFVLFHRGHRFSGVPIVGVSKEHVAAFQQRLPGAVIDPRRMIQRQEYQRPLVIRVFDACIETGKRLRA